MPRRISSLAGVAALGLLLAATPARAAPVQVSSDPFTDNLTGQHSTEVEPDSFASGARIVSAFQVGRYSDGGGAAIGYAVSSNHGLSWTHGLIPGLTIATENGGTHARATDAAVAYDKAHDTWLVNATALAAPPNIRGEAVTVNRSGDGGVTWHPAVNVAPAVVGSDFDKNWIVCDDTAASPFYGHCYVEWDDFGDGGRLLMSTSVDGGQTWGPAKATSNNAHGLGGQPVVRPNGTVIVPYADSSEEGIGAFRSTDGGSTWSAAKHITDVPHHAVGGPIRSGALPSAEIDATGRVFVAWEDCRFRVACDANDIVFMTSTDGLTWSAVRRVPIDGVNSGIDHFVPGLGVDRATRGTHAHLALAYHYMPDSRCQGDACRVFVGFVDSLDGGAHWSKPRTLAGPMVPTWLASTSEGYMTGDYISTSFALGAPHPLIAVAHAPSAGKLHEAIWAAGPRMLGPPPPKARRLTRLAVDPGRFRARRSGPSVSHSGPTRVSYRASAAGTTRFTVERAEKRHGTRVWVKLRGGFSRSDRKGRNSFRFTGRLHGALRAARYRLIARPHDRGRPRGKRLSARFTILPPR